MKKSGFTLVELTISTLIITIIATILVIVLRSNLNTFKFGQKHMDFNQRVLLAMRRIFYDLKRINPVLVKSVKYGYSLKGENIGEPKPRKIFIRKSKEPNLGKDELEFVIDSNNNIEELYNIKYYLKGKSLKREVRNMDSKTKVETILDNVTSFYVDNNERDIKQVYVKFVANDIKENLKRDVDFAVRLETDFVYVDKTELQ
jgi:prepilin-type N-terminal cleavage/methylation domain-containing protein